MNDEVTTADLCRLLGVSRETLSSLAKRGIVVRSGKRGAYALEASVSGYCKHLRDMASARGGEDAIAVRAKLASAQADLAAEKVKVIRAETVPAAEVEALWTSKLRAFRNRILAIPSRVSYLSLRQRESLTRELRAALTELAEGLNVAHHYDHSHALFEAILDQDLQYSCAYFAASGTHPVASAGGSQDSRGDS